MNRILIFVFLFAVMSMAAIHAGLQDAIDKNDIAKASAIIQNLGVKDIYCPANLSVANGKKLYGKRFSENPNLLYANCDESFIQAYTKDACADKINEGLCKQVLSKTPIENWLPYLKLIRKNKLDKKPEEYQELVELKGKRKRTREQCKLAIEESGDDYMLLQDLAENGDPNYDKVYNEMISKCMKEPVVVGHETVTKTRIVNPFQNYYAQFLTNVIANSKKLVGFTKENSEAIVFVKSLEFTKGIEEKFINICTSSYRDSSYVNDMIMISTCRFFPNFDKLLEKKAGFSMFSCKTVLDIYSEKNVPACNVTSKNLVYSTVPIMNGAPAFSFSCNKGVWGPYTQQMKDARETKKRDLDQNADVTTSSIEKVGVTIRTNPDDAMVSIDGKILKVRSPVFGKMKPGRHEILISKDGYLVKDTTFMVTGDKSAQTLKVSLEPIGEGSF